jgi:hypothetical protein
LRFTRNRRFDADFRHLTPSERIAFRDAVRAFNAACDEFQHSKGASGWPASLRVKPMRSVPGVWEMTWSYSGPDGRATWEWITSESGEPTVRWRRVGNHSIFRDP